MSAGEAWPTRIAMTVADNPRLELKRDVDVPQAVQFQVSQASPASDGDEGAVRLARIQR
jgi:hypothetical protein